MQITLQKLKNNSKSYDVHTLFLHQDVKLNSQPSIVKQVFDDKLFSGKKNEVLFLPFASISKGKHLLLIGLGSKKSVNHESLRLAAGTACKVLKQKKISSAAVDLSYVSFIKPEASVKALGEGFLIGDYNFNDHIQKNKKKSASDKTLKEIIFLAPNDLKKTGASSPVLALEKAKALSEGTNFARWVGDQPGNLMTPAILAEQVKKKFQGSKVTVSVWNKERIKKERMGGLLGVSLGSVQEPRFIIMEYKGGKASKKPICFVGKGVTFDSGGISIKPSPKMDEMKYDMCGSAAVIGTMMAISKLKLKVNVLALVPAVENMPGAAATKPGDILTARNGKTMEVLNTDAEGRLILADALSYACEKKPVVIFDAATLTGSMVVALGNSHTGFFTRNTSLSKRIEKAAHASGESVWGLPLTDDHSFDIKSMSADVANISTQHFGAGSATAAAFLENFVEKDIPWAHFDIAGTAWNVSRRLSYINKGASGVMVRTFFELAVSYQ